MTLSQSRVTIVEKIYHRLPGQSPTLIRSAFNFLPETEEQLYVRYDQKATEDWTPLDYGWIESPSLVVIKNTEGQGLSVNPSNKEKADITRRIIQLRLGDGPASELEVLPGEAQRLRTRQPLFIRCVNGSARYSLWAIPR